jgi:hypothetical protein
MLEARATVRKDARRTAEVADRYHQHALVQSVLTLHKRNGTVLDHVSTSTSLGDKVTLHLSAATEEKYYIQMDSISTDAFSGGAYVVASKYDSLLTTSAVNIDKYVLEGFRWQTRTDDGDAGVDVRKTDADRRVTRRSMKPKNAKTLLK